MQQVFQHLQALIAAIKARDAASDESRSAEKAENVAIILNRTEYDLAVMLGDPYPDEVYDAMDAVRNAHQEEWQACRDYADALRLADSYVEAVQVKQ